MELMPNKFAARRHTVTVVVTLPRLDALRPEARGDHVSAGVLTHKLLGAGNQVGAGLFGDGVGLRCWLLKARIIVDVVFSYSNRGIDFNQRFFLR